MTLRGPDPAIKRPWAKDRFTWADMKQMENGTKQGGEWWHDPKSLTWRYSGKSNARKAASASIAKIPFPLASWIAKCWKPEALPVREK